MKRAVAVSIACLIFAALQGGVASAQYPADAVDVTVSDTTVVPGEAITVSGDDFQPGSEVSVELGDQVLGTFFVNEEGSFSGRVTIPEGTPPGTHYLRVVGIGDDGEPRVLRVAIEVLATREATLPFTGAGIPVGVVILAVALILAGSALLVSRRRAESRRSG